MNEKAMIIAAKKGDKKAFESIVDKYYNAIFHTALGIMRNSWDAMDMCQDAFTKAFISLDALKDISSFKAWLSRILINCCNDHFRRNKNLILSENIEEEGFFEYENEDALDVLRALSSLSREIRTTLSLRYIQDMKITEIAACMNCPEGTVKSRISSGLKELRKIMRAGDSKEVAK